MLPTPGSGFRWVATAHGPALVCAALEPFAPHLFTTRPWRLGSAAAGEDPEAWAEVGRAMRVGPAGLVRVRQVHGAAAVVGSAGGRPASGARPRADVIVSADPDAAIAVQAADCVPLLVADRRTGAVAAVHSGWRGTALDTAAGAVGAMRRAFRSRPADLVMAIGPAIGACCYEVGRDVRDRFAAAGFGRHAIDRWFRERPLEIDGNPPMPGLPSPPRADHWYFDGWTATRDELVAAGVPPEQIHLARLCTASHPDVLCSHRREGPAAGRLAAAIRAARRER